jgi:hypothetical protein
MVDLKGHDAADYQALVFQQILNSLGSIERKVDLKADKNDLLALEGRLTNSHQELHLRVSELERHGSSGMQGVVVRLKTAESEIDRLQAWRNRLAGAVALVILLLLPLAGLVLTYIAQ